MLTAAVRDLHLTFPRQFLTDVRTTCKPLWEYNPHLTALSEDDPAVEQIDCHYPLIHHCNERPFHFIQGFTEFLSEQLGIRIQPTLFRGDIHLAPKERRWISQVQEITEKQSRFGSSSPGASTIIRSSGGATIAFRRSWISFAERSYLSRPGISGHEHRRLDGVLDLRGKTNLRQFVRLMHHAQGVVCPVTFAMHLAAAVEARADQARHRPCVVIAGGREPAHWEAYPHHQLSTRSARCLVVPRAAAGDLVRCRWAMGIRRMKAFAPRWWTIFPSA